MLLPEDASSSNGTCTAIQVTEVASVLIVQLVEIPLLEWVEDLSHVCARLADHMWPLVQIPGDQASVAKHAADARGRPGALREDLL